MDRVQSAKIINAEEIKKLHSFFAKLQENLKKDVREGGTSAIIEGNL
jgi:hypothetical protein